MGFFLDTNTWVLFSFLVFLGVLWKLGRGAFLKMIDERIEDIKKEIQSAEALRIEAQELLAQYQRKYRDAILESKRIVDTAQAQAEKIKEKAQADLLESMERREKQLQERLKRMEQAAIAEIQKYAADLSIQATSEIIANQLDKKANDALVDQAIKDVGKTISK